MFHLVARALPGRLIFATHAEAAELFAILLRTFPDCVALCLMPDHVHIVTAGDPAELGVAMGAYARWRNKRHRTSGPLWQPHPEPERLPDAQHQRRTIRYVHLNPCRAGLAADPLEWPWSTHRDAVGRAAPCVRTPEREPDRFHRWVSGDPSVNVVGTPLLACQSGDVSWEMVVSAVSSVCRVHPRALSSRGDARTLAVRTAWVLELRDTERLAKHLGLSRTSVYRATAGTPPRGPRPRRLLPRNGGPPRDRDRRRSARSSAISTIVTSSSPFRRPWARSSWQSSR